MYMHFFLEFAYERTYSKFGFLVIPLLNMSVCLFQTRLGTPFLSETFEDEAYKRNC